MPLRRVLRITLVAGLAGFALAATGTPPAAAADHSYEAAIVATRGLVKEALNGSRERIPDAIRTLEGGTGSTQPEILADLRASPPDLKDADLRLAAVEAALNRPGDGGDPTQSRQDVQRIINLPRFDSMRGSESVWDRFVAWALQLIAALLLYLVTTVSLSQPVLLGLVGAFLLLVGAIAFVVLRTNWTRGTSPASDRPGDLRTAVRDRFRAADRLAREGDFTAAQRELVAAVAGEVGNRPFWDTSPLTVRELFAGAGLLVELEPLLAPFEASVYGRRRITDAEFAAALRAAAGYRSEEATTAA